jgi:uncharacterized surface protein with fasciclin (FAS1) repeats
MKTKDIAAITGALACVALLATGNPARAGGMNGYEKKNIVETAVAAGNFKTLAKALDAAGLVGTLEGTGPFTVFAPTDAAFAKLPAGALEALLADKAKLKSVLLYHVVAGNVSAKQAMKLTSAKTVEGSDVAISTEDGKVMVGDAQVVKADLGCSNGTIHVIDAVLLPTM